MAILNMVGGGGGGLKSTDAILRVIAPAGSTVTISKGGVSKSDLGHENASDTSLYDYYFIIHASQFDSVNPWTVTATLGTQTMSDTIIIDSADEYDVVISYTLWLVKGGVAQDGAFIAVGKGYDSSSAATATPTITQGSGYLQIGLSTGTAGYGMVYLPNKYDLSKYNTVNVYGSARCENATRHALGFSAWTAIGTYQSDNLVVRSALLSENQSSYTYINDSFDIAEIADSCYVGFNFSRTTSVQSYVRVIDFYLEA